MDYDHRDFEYQNGVLVLKRPSLIIGGTFSGKLIRDDRVIDEWEDHNLIVNQGLDHILAVEFTGAAQITQWYMGVFSNNYSPVATDAASNFAASAGENTSYTGSTRVAYAGAEANQQVTNAAAPANFTFNANVTLYGAFLASASARNATTGVLFAASQFTTPKVVETGDQLLLTYAFGAASA